MWLRRTLLEPEHFGIDIAVRRPRLAAARWWLPGTIPVLAAAFIEMDELLVADQKITDVHISNTSAAGEVGDVCCGSRVVDYEASKEDERARWGLRLTGDRGVVVVVGGARERINHNYRTERN
jgi:hypothetical protein